MEYKIISTGSKGNAVVVNGRILIDCGVPFRRLESVYRDLDAVLLTHIHSDHFQPKTLARLAAERPSLRFFACPWLGPDLQNAGVPLRQITITTPDRWYDTGYCFVKACETKHNVRNCCWHIWFNDGSKWRWVIKSMAIKMKHTDKDGTWTHTTVSVTLMEYLAQ